MKTVRPSSLEEYATWYLDRETHKGSRAVIPAQARGRVQRMLDQHSGKMRDWFDGRARWTIMLLNELVEFEQLIFLESDWTKAEGLVVPDASLNYRLLRKVARNARASNYLSLPSASRHCEYYEAIQGGELRLEGDSRIGLCSAEDSERRLNPDGTWYLLDGVGRCLPYMMLIQLQVLQFTPVEALVAERIA